MPAFGADRSDHDLVEAIRQSDAEAFKVLYYRYHDALLRFIRQRIHNTDLARDLTQDVFTSVWKNRLNLNSIRSIKAYLYRSANNHVIDYLRKHAHEETYLAEHIDETNFITPPPNDNFELQEHLEAAIKSLPPPLQQVFVLNRFEGCTYREIADILDVSVKTIEVRMGRALRLLRDRLRPFLTIILSSSIFL